MPNSDDILHLRLHRQSIERSADTALADPADVVSHLFAMQAQDYAGALWAVGLRCTPGTTTADVEHAIAERRIVRTWPLRGTLHLVAPADVRWMLALLAPRVIARAAGRHAQLGLTDEIFARARTVFASALAGGRVLTRAEMMALLESSGISTAGQRGYHILWLLAQEAMLCCGPMAGKQQTFVLLDDWIPSDQEPSLERGKALAQLAARYFEAHGPATLTDLAWWAGITKNEARAAVDATSGRLQRIVSNGAEYWLAERVATDGHDSRPAGASGAPGANTPNVHLLPGFDEYMLGYTDRSLQLGEHRERYSTTVASNGMFSPTLVIDGRIAGTWKRTLKRNHVEIAVRAFRPLNDAESSELAEAAHDYGRFLGLPAMLEF